MTVAIAQFTVKDLNDITVASTAPTGPTNGQLWLDTSIVPNLLKKYNGSAWDVVNDVVIGGRNLWIVEDAVAGYESSGNIVSAASCHQIMQTLTTIKPNDVLTWQIWNPNLIANTANTNRFAFFDASSNYISSVTLPYLSGASYQTGKVTAPANAYKVRLGVIQGTNGSTKDDSIKIKIEVGNKPTDWTPAPEDVQGQIDSINASITEMTSDNELTAEEKQLIKKDLDAITQEKTQLDTQAGIYGITTEKNNYDTSYTNLYNYVNPLLADLTKTSPVTGTALREDFSDYFAKRTILQNKIADTAAQIKADAIVVGGRNLVGKFNIANMSTISSNSKSGYGFILPATSTPYVCEFNNLSLKPNTDYILTFVAWCGSGTLSLENDLIPDTLPEESITVTTTPTKYTWHINSNLSDMTACALRFWDYNENGTTPASPIYITDIKLELGNKSTDWSPAPEDVQSQIDAINSSITEMSSDNILTAEEKQLIKKDLDSCTNEKAQLDAQAGTYGITTEKNNYDTSYNTLYSYINPLMSDLTKSSPVTGTQLRGDFSDYFAKRAILQNKIADIAATIKVNAIQLGVRNLIRNSNGFFGGTYWSSAITAIDSDSIYGKAFRINNTATTEITIAQTIEIDVLPNTQYTFSALAKGDANVSTFEMYAIGRKSSDSAFAYTYIHGSGNKILSMTYTKFSFTFTTNSDEVKLFVRFDHNGSKTSGTLAQLWATDFKLEQGNKATDWSPAPEDAQSQIDGLNDFVNNTYPDDQTDVYDAIDNATSQLAGTTGGYVVIDQDANKKPYEILIMDTPDRGTAKNVWRWNSGGLGFSSNGYNGPYTTAITSDGKIVADFITTGNLAANLIKGGVLTLGGKNESGGNNVNGSEIIEDTNGHKIITLDNTGIDIFNGSINIYSGADTTSQKLMSIDSNGNIVISGTQSIYYGRGNCSYSTTIALDCIKFNTEFLPGITSVGNYNGYEISLSSPDSGPDYCGTTVVSAHQIETPRLHVDDGIITDGFILGATGDGCASHWYQVMYFTCNPQYDHVNLRFAVVGRLGARYDIYFSAEMGAGSWNTPTLEIYDYSNGGGHGNFRYVCDNTNKTVYLYYNRSYSDWNEERMKLIEHDLSFNEDFIIPIVPNNDMGTGAPTGDLYGDAVDCNFIMSNRAQQYIGTGNCRIDTTNGALRLYTSALGSADYGIKINANGEVDFVNNNSSYAYINGSGVAAAKYLRTIYGTGIGVNITENTVDSCTGRLWLNYYSGSSVLIGNGAGNGGYGSLDCGNFTVHGSKNRAVDTENYGTRLMNAFETPECLFADRGRGKIVNGQCIINVDPIFLETVNTKDFSYDVITFPYGPGKVWTLTSEMYSDKFIVRGDTDIEFGYMIIAKQKDYENIRLEQYVNNDPELVV